jgi:two-component system, cell cycle sensor histidine kinase and response regulator CckA
MCADHSKLHELEQEVHCLRSEVTRLQKALVANRTGFGAGEEPDRSAALFRAVYDQALHPAGIVDLQGVLRHANRTAQELTGEDPSKFIGRPFWETSWWAPASEDREKLRDGIRRAARGEFVQFETTHPDSDGARRRMDFTLRPARDDDGQVFCLIAEARDITARKEAEEALREKTVELERYFNNALDLLCIADTNGYFRRLNPAWETALGYRVEELEGQRFLDFIHPDDLEPTLLALSRLGEQKEVLDFVNRYRARDGSYRWIEWRSFPSGNAIYAAARDITEGTLARTALEESRRMLRLVLDTIPVRVFWKDDEGRYQGCNRPFASDAGFASPEALLGKTDYDMGWRKQAELYRADDRQVIASGVPKLGYEEPQTTPSGAQLCLRTSKIPLRDGEGRIVGVLGTYEDITESKQAERALRESVTQLRTVVTNAPIVLFSFDRNGIFTLSEGKGLAGMGNVMGEVLGRSIYEVFRDQPDALGNMRRAHAGETFSTPVSIGDRVFEAHHTPLPDDQGAYSGTIGVLVDITERQRAEEERGRLQAQLLQAQKMESVGRLAGGVAHDFNNMLMIILGFSELIKKRRSGDTSLLAEIAEIERAAIRARDITRQLLAFSRQQVVAPRPLNLSELLADTRRTLGRLIGEDVDLRFHLGAGLWLVRMDPSQVDQVLMNLAVNARDAMPSGGKLTIETSNVRIDEAYSRQHTGFRPGDYVLLTVSDSGVGMDRETVSHIFEPFFTTKAAGKGTGLGLATVYGVVTQNGGVVNVYSEPGRGSTFKVYLPRLLDAVATAASVEEAPVAPGSGTLLLVEDDETVRRLTAAMLEALGFVVLATGGWREALAVAERRDTEIDLLLTDVVMPEMGGRELGDRLRALNPELRVLYMSGYTANVIVHHGVLEEGVHFIQKPFTLDDLARKVRDALRPDGDPASPVP